MTNCRLIERNRNGWALLYDTSARWSELQFSLKIANWGYSSGKKSSVRRRAMPSGSFGSKDRGNVIFRVHSSICVRQAIWVGCLLSFHKVTIKSTAVFSHDICREKMRKLWSIKHRVRFQLQMESFQFYHLQAFEFSREGLKHIAYVWEKAGFVSQTKPSAPIWQERSRYRRLVNNGFIDV
jgi:hypothetical protein